MKYKKAPFTTTTERSHDPPALYEDTLNVIATRLQENQRVRHDPDGYDEGISPHKDMGIDPDQFSQSVLKLRDSLSLLKNNFRKYLDDRERPDAYLTDADLSEHAAESTVNTFPCVQAEKEQLTSEQTVTLSNPDYVNHKASPGKRREYDDVESLPPVNAYEIRNVTLYGEVATAFTTDTNQYILVDTAANPYRLGRPLANNILHYANHIRQINNSTHNTDSTPESDEPGAGKYNNNGAETVTETPQVETADFEVAVSLVGKHADNFYHWFIEYFPRLRAAEWYAEKTGVMPTILIPPEPDWFRPILKRLGYWEYVEIWTYDSATVDTFITCHGAHPRRDSVLLQPAQLEWVRNKILDEYGITPDHTKTPREVIDIDTHLSNDNRNSQPNGVREKITRLLTRQPARPELPDSRHLYVSRESQEERYVTNQDDLIASLPNSFVVVKPEEFPFETQVQMFQHADTVVGVYGTQLTNILWASEINVFEIFGNIRRGLYYQLSEHCGHNYQRVQFREDEHGGIHVDPEVVSQATRELLNQSSTS